MAGETTLSRLTRLVTDLPLSCPYYSEDPNASLAEKSHGESGSHAELEFRISPRLPQTCCQYNSLLTVKGETWSLCTCYRFNICSKPNPGIHTQQKTCSPSRHCCLCLPVIPSSSSLPLLSLCTSPLILSPFSFLHSSKLSVSVVSFPH